MQICVDENIPNLTVIELRELGHDVLDLRGSVYQGISDKLLWSKAQSEKRLLVTTDKGFTAHRGEAHHGLLIVRLHQPNEAKIHNRIMKAIKELPEDEWKSLVVVMRDVVQSVWRYQS